MDRLTIRLENGQADLKTTELKDPCEFCYDMIQKLAYYEDLEEQKRLIVLASNEDQLKMFKDKCKICIYWSGESCKKIQCPIYIKIKELSR